MKAPKIGKGTYDGGTSAGGFLTRDNTLHFEGKGVAGAKITIFSDGVKIGTAKVDKKGKWSFDSKALPDGPHSFTAKAKLGKDASPASKALAGEIDATAPPAPGKPDLATASDTGSSSTDDITSDTTPTLTGTAEAGATVTIKDGATVLGTVTAHATTGQWSFTTGVLSNAAHSLTVTATDKAGNVSAPSAALVVTVDASASAPLITGFASDTGGVGDRVTLDTTLLITGTAEAGATVQVFDGLVSLGPATANGAGVWSFPTAVLAAGHHTFTAEQTDAAGNVSAVSAAHTVRVGYDIDTATMTPSEGFRIFGADAGDSAGYSVSSAGDINGDGFDDLIVGAKFGDGAANGKSNAGEAIVVFGKATGFADVDAGAADFVSSGKGFSIFGADADDYAGSSVSAAGDINGDGYGDLIVGANGNGAANGKSNAGEAIVVFGKATGFADVDVSAVDFVSSGKGFRIFGADGNDNAGYSVSSAGDINGDGYDDLIVGARTSDGPGNSRNGAGEAIVVFGKASGFADVDISAVDFVSSGKGFRIYGADFSDQAGASVSAAGDINGDGFDDLIVGAKFGDGAANVKYQGGEAIVVFGKATGFADTDVSTMTGADGFRIFGADADDYAGFSVSTAGDINGDGFDDLVVGATGADGAANVKNSAGEAIVVFGKAGIADVDVSASDFVSSGNGFRIFGADANDGAGYSVSSAGDINGDGFDDLLVGAKNSGGAANGKIYAGEAIVVFGKATGFADVDVTTMTAAQGFRIYGADASDSAGYSVSSAGDINGDGFDDLLVGAPFGDGAANGKSNAGEAIVIYGGNLTGSVVHAGTSGANTLTGTSAAETFVGGQGNDILTGGGGADAFQGGAGNDTVTVADLLFRKVDGGSGTDTLVFSGNAQTIDFTTFANNKVVGIEGMDVAGSGADTIVIGALDALHFSDTPHAGFTAAASNTRLVVTGDLGDTLDLRDYAPGSGGDYTWVNAGEDQSLSGGAGGFDFYNLMRNSEVLASVAVDADMSIL